jgi:hypothetical protein
MPSRNRNREARRTRDENGLPVVFALTPKQAADVTAAAENAGVDPDVVTYMKDKIAWRADQNATQAVPLGAQQPEPNAARQQFAHRRNEAQARSAGRRPQRAA